MLKDHAVLIQKLERLAAQVRSLSEALQELERDICGLQHKIMMLEE